MTLTQWLELAAMNGVIFVAAMAHGWIVNKRVRQARREVHDEWMRWLRGQRP